jgi:Rrf2 family transcriptional regulator, cysteine metabolism repressor
MLDLALNYTQGPTSLKEIAERQQISPKYLEQVLTTLQSADLVRAVRGPKGGYLLSKVPARINLRQVYEVLEGTEGFVRCSAVPAECPRSDACVTQEVWAQMYAASLAVLELTTLETLVRRAKEKEKNASSMYYI